MKNISSWIGAGLIVLATSSYAQATPANPSVCERSLGVQNTIVKAAHTPCEKITQEDLANLYIEPFEIIGTTRARDFAGLKSVLVGAWGSYLVFEQDGVLADDTFVGMLAPDDDSQIQLNLFPSASLRIEPNAFRGIPELKGLYINAPEKKSAPAHRIELANVNWSDVPLLDFLCLASNPLRPRTNECVIAIDDSTFRGATALTLLMINGCRVERITQNAFSSLSQLEYLEFVQTRIKGLPSGVFRPLQKLKTLNFQLDAIDAVPPGAFDGLAKLNYVYLADDHLDALPDHLFDQNPALLIVHLGKNSFQDLNPELFTPLLSNPKFKLELEFNPLSDETKFRLKEKLGNQVSW